MSDPLSLAAGIGGLITLTLQVIKINKDYIDSVKNAPKVLNAYLQELLMLQSSLTLLKERLSDQEVIVYLARKQRQSPTILQDARNGIDGCSTELRKIISSIAKKDKVPMLTRMTFYFSQAEIEKDLQRLQRYRAMIIDNFNNTLSTENSKHLQEITVTVSEVEQLSKTMLEEVHAIDVNLGRIERLGDRTLASIETTQGRNNGASTFNLCEFVSVIHIESYRSSVFSWLSTMDPSANHNTARKLHEADTGRWLTDSPPYNEWYKSSGRILWLHGIAGSGKTVLCSTVIEDVRRRHIEAGSDPDIGFAYFYFDFQESGKQSTINLIRNLIRQLCSSRSSSWSTLAKLFEEWRKSGQQPLHTVMSDLLVEVVSEMEKTFIIIDAFDECTEKDDALTMVIELFDRLSGKLNVFVTSRPESFIERSLHDLDDESQCLIKIAARNAEADKDISDFVKARMEKDRKLRKWRSEADHIVDTLVEQANGM